MKVLFDYQVFSLQSHGGISRYFCELYSQFLKMGLAEPQISVLHSENSHYRDLFQSTPFFFPLNISGQSKRIAQINKIYSKFCINQRNFDIFHPTYYDSYFLKLLKTKPYVLTVYDMIHELFPDLFKNDGTVVQKKMSINGATRIIAISANTKKDILKFYDVDPDIIETIPLATSLDTRKPDSSLNLPEKYILFVGDRWLYKNFDFFIRSISDLLSEDSSLCLLCAGGGVFADIELNLFKELKIINKVFHYPIVDDSTLSQLYRKAILFVFPSLYEGFGIPVLEAFSCGCPVAASYCSSFSEVGGDAVKYFDPYNSRSIQDTVHDVVLNETLQESLRIRGYQQLKLFSWEKTALNTWKVYENVVCH